MKHILSFLFLIVLAQPLLPALESESSIKIVVENGTVYRTGFSSTYKNLAASVFTSHTRELTKLNNWYIKSTEVQNISWLFGTVSFQGIVSFAKNPDFTVQNTALQKNTLSKGTIIPVLPGISSSSMKNAAFISWSQPPGPGFHPLVSFLYSAKDSAGNNNDSTLALSLSFPFTFNNLYLASTFTAFNYDRALNSASSWYTQVPYITPGRYFIFTNASMIKIPLLEIAVFTGMSEVSKTQWKFNCLTELLTKIPVSNLYFILQGKFFISSYDYITLADKNERTVFHYSINPQAVIPLNRKKSFKLSFGILNDYKKSFSLSFPAIEQTDNCIKASLGLIHTFASAEFHCSADNTFDPGFINANTYMQFKLNYAVNLWRFTIIPLKITGFIRCASIPFSGRLYETISVYANTKFTPSNKKDFSLSAGTQFNFSNNADSFESFSVHSEASLHAFQLSGNFDKNCVTRKHSFSVSLSYRLGALY
ncbi:MAG TPA: hypothetical protein PLU33_02755 [Treponemataceae bacterium]|nr:hypothetical protein [Treponemataceae bacterium]